MSTRSGDSSPRTQPPSSPDTSSTTSASSAWRGWLTRAFTPDALWEVTGPHGSIRVWLSDVLRDGAMIKMSPGDHVARVTGRRYWAAVMTRPRISLADVLWIVSMTWIVGRLGKAAGWW